MTYQLIFILRLILQCILIQTNEQGHFQPHIFSRRHYSLSHVMLRPRLFSLAGEYPDGSYRLRLWVRRPAYSHIECWLPSLWVRVISCSSTLCPARFTVMNMVANCAHCWCVSAPVKTTQLHHLKWISYAPALIQSTCDSCVTALKVTRQAYSRCHE